MSVVDAVCMSMSVPFLFESCRHNSCTYIDGGLREAVPALAFLNKDPKDVLVLKFEKHKTLTPEIKSVKDFILCLVNVAVESSVAYQSFSKEISLDMEGFDMFDFTMSYEDKMKLYIKGYQTALIHLGSFK
jgi:predicted acylesterase/phospholipase RssA